MADYNLVLPSASLPKYLTMTPPLYTCFKTYMETHTAPSSDPLFIPEDDEDRSPLLMGQNRDGPQLQDVLATAVRHQQTSSAVRLQQPTSRGQNANLSKASEVKRMKQDVRAVNLAKKIQVTASLYLLEQSSGKRTKKAMVLSEVRNNNPSMLFYADFASRSLA